MPNFPFAQNYKKNGASYRNMRYPLQQWPLQLYRKSKHTKPFSESLTLLLILPNFLIFVKR